MVRLRQLSECMRRGPMTSLRMATSSLLPPLMVERQVEETLVMMWKIASSRSSSVSNINPISTMSRVMAPAKIKMMMRIVGCVWTLISGLWTCGQQWRTSYSDTLPQHPSHHITIIDIVTTHVLHHQFHTLVQQLHSAREIARPHRHVHHHRPCSKC